MNFHFRYPEHSGCIRFFHGTLRSKSFPDQECYFEHPIKWWYGISFARLFIGVIRTEPTRDVRQTAPQS